MYEIIYLPIAKKDLAEIATYITDHLKAPLAAMDLLKTLNNPYPGLANFRIPAKYINQLKYWKANIGFYQSRISY